jgi:hypothetical protein
VIHHVGANAERADPTAEVGETTDVKARRRDVVVIANGKGGATEDPEADGRGGRLGGGLCLHGER